MLAHCSLVSSSLTTTLNHTHKEVSRPPFTVGRNYRTNVSSSSMFSEIRFEIVFSVEKLPRVGDERVMEMSAPAILTMLPYYDTSGSVERGVFYRVPVVSPVTVLTFRWQWRSPFDFTTTALQSYSRLLSTGNGQLNWHLYVSTSFFSFFSLTNLQSHPTMWIIQTNRPEEPVLYLEFHNTNNWERFRNLLTRGLELSDEQEHRLHQQLTSYLATTRSTTAVQLPTPPAYVAPPPYIALRRGGDTEQAGQARTRGPVTCLKLVQMLGAMILLAIRYIFVILYGTLDLYCM